MTLQQITKILALLALLPGIAAAWTSDELLMRAIRNGDHTAAAALLGDGAGPNQQLADGSTLLAWAVDSQDREMVRLLLDADASPVNLGNPSADPLIVACQYGDPVILDMLLTAGARVNAMRSDGISALSICAGNISSAGVRRLIDGGAEVDKADNRGQTPLMWAAAKGRVDNMALLIQYGADVNRVTDKGFTPLFFALKSGEPRAPLTVLEAGGNQDYIAPDGTTVVQLAMYQKAYDFAARMIERGVNLEAFDRNGNQLLHAAVLADQPSLVDLLLSKGADVNRVTGPSSVEWRFERNFTSADYYVPPKSPLLLAAERGNAGIMQLLVEAGADTRFRSELGMDVVLSAAASGTFAALQLALELEPVPNVTTSTGDTPLHLLLNSGGRTDGTGAEFGPMMRLLEEKGTRTDIMNSNGQTAADIAQDAQIDARMAFEAAFGK